MQTYEELYRDLVNAVDAAHNTETAHETQERFEACPICRAVSADSYILAAEKVEFYSKYHAPGRKPMVSEEAADRVAEAVNALRRAVFAFDSADGLSEMLWNTIIAAEQSRLQEGN